MKVLLVSSSERARAWMRSAIGPAYSVSEAAEGTQALAQAVDGEYRVVIADETTVPYGAFGLTRELKFLEEPPAVIVLLERTADVWLANWAGADRSLVQPVDPFALAAALREVAGEPAAEAAER